MQSQAAGQLKGHKRSTRHAARKTERNAVSPLSVEALETKIFYEAISQVTPSLYKNVLTPGLNKGIMVPYHPIDSDFLTRFCYQINRERIKNEQRST